MKEHLQRSLVVLWVAVVAAGVASGDPPPWTGRWSHDRHERRDEGSQTHGRPILLGRTGSDFRGERYLDVRGHDTTYVVDVSRADIRGARRGQIRRGDRVLVWGRLIGRKALAASRIQVLGDSDKIPCAECGKLDCLHGDRDNYEPRFDPRPDPREDPDYRTNRTLEGRVTRASNRLSHRDISVASLGMEWKVEVPAEARITRGDGTTSVHSIGVGEYVRIRGERVGDRTFRADSIEVDARTDSTSWPGARPDDDGAYTGSIRSLDGRGGTFALRLNFFETYTVRVTYDTRLVRDGHKADFRELRENDRVRVQGRLDAGARILEARVVEVL